MDIRIALVGMGGYGEGYAYELLMNSGHHGVQLVAGIDPLPDGCRCLPDFQDAGIPIFPSLQFYFAHAHAELVVISSPIHMHAPQTCLALAHGAYVLCEKPACAVIQDAHRMAEAATRAGKFIAIGYQWSFSTAIQALKRDIMEGAFGHPKRLKTYVLWPRLASYYQRNRWSGRIKSDSGDWVLDSPANNAMAHYLHNMFYVLGSTTETSARPVRVQAELYRANSIENYDAIALRVLTKENIELLFYGAHSVPDKVDPIFSFEFEAATIEYTASSGSGIIARFKNGIERHYGDPNAPGEEWEKIWQSVESIRTGKPVVCGISAASAHTLCINGAQESCDVTAIPQEYVRVEARSGTDTLTWASGLQEAFTQSYTQGSLPAETGSLSWARPGKTIDLQHYEQFPGGR